MIAILTAVVVTGLALLDYLWPHLEQTSRTPERFRRLKLTIMGAMIVVAWWLAMLQVLSERKADKDMTFLKSQLESANHSLTNSTAALHGLSTGGNSRAEIYFGYAIDKTNAMTATMMQKGEYPIRGLGIRIIDMTKRLNAFHTEHPPQPGPVLFERHFGDVAIGSYCDLCTLQFDPLITNYYKCEVSALNGSYQEIIAFSMIDTNWAMRLVYKEGSIAGKREIDPPSMRDKIVLY